MQVQPNNPVIVQGDGKVLLETKHPKYEAARDFLSRFAELEASPNLLHTYRITPLSLWNAASAGMDAELIIKTLAGYSKFDIPNEVKTNIQEMLARYGLVKLIPHPEKPNEFIRLQFETPYIAKLVSQDPRLRSVLVDDKKKH